MNLRRLARRLLPRFLVSAIFTLCAMPEIHALPQVILKLDDLRYRSGTAVDPGWERIVRFLEENRIPGSIGIIADSLEGAGDEYYDWIRMHHRRGLIEFWHHGFDHSREDASSVTWWEFRNTDYAFQKEHFSRGMELAEEKLGFRFRTFGAPYNQTDATTVQVLEEDPDIRVWLYGETSPTHSKMVLKRIGALNLERSVGVPDAQAMRNNFGSYLEEEVIVLQGHPAQWGEGDWAEFLDLIAFLQEQGVRFTTPWRYYREVNQLPYVIIKADNVGYDFAANAPIPQWQRFLDFLHERNLAAAVGLRGDTLEDQAGRDKSSYYEWLRNAAEEGAFEYFLYGYDHSRDQANSPPTWWEFRNTDYSFQKQHFDRVAELAEGKLGITLESFGASWNQTDATTLQILEESPEIKVWLYGNPNVETSKLVLRRYGDINIEQPVHEPNLAYFKEHYPAYADREILVIQGHPEDWETDEAFAEFVGIVDYLLDQGAEFVTPMEYHEIVRPSGVHSFEWSLPSAAGVRYQMERSNDLESWERFGDQYFGNDEARVHTLVFQDEAVSQFFRTIEVPADEPLYVNDFDDLSSFNDLSPAVADAEAGVVLLDATTDPVNPLGEGSALRFYDYSISAGVRAFEDVSLPRAFKLELLFSNLNVESTNPWEGPTFRFGNSGASLASSSNAAFYINFRKDNTIRAYHGEGNTDLIPGDGLVHRLTLYINADESASIGYEGPSDSRTLAPASFDAYVDDVRVGSMSSGFPFINPAGYDASKGLGRFGFVTASTQQGGDFVFDRLLISPLE
jgi:peptidoglycan/xylan/chitin deacetylase (PgdA/CDA1 family)